MPSCLVAPSEPNRGLSATPALTRRTVEPAVAVPDKGRYGPVTTIADRLPPLFAAGLGAVAAPGHSRPMFGFDRTVVGGRP